MEAHQTLRYLGNYQIAHYFYSKKGFNVDSYGTNSVIKIPGPAADKPNSYPFGITYEDIYQDLLAKDPNLYYASLSICVLSKSLDTLLMGC